MPGVSRAGHSLIARGGHHVPPGIQNRPEARTLVTASSRAEFGKLALPTAGAARQWHHDLALDVEELVDAGDGLEGDRRDRRGVLAPAARGDIGKLEELAPGDAHAGARAPAADCSRHGGRACSMPGKQPRCCPHFSNSTIPSSFGPVIVPQSRQEKRSGTVGSSPEARGRRVAWAVIRERPARWALALEGGDACRPYRAPTASSSSVASASSSRR